MLSFIHLSDIHFMKNSGDSFDVDEDLRNEIIYDITHCLPRYIDHIDGVLVCGDIAFSGKQSEYDIATKFLEEMCSKADIDDSKIFCVPGNHDVDQEITKNSECLQYLQQKLENSPNITECDRNVAKIFRSECDAQTLYSPISCYNELFAAKYSCSLAPNKLTWSQELEINPKYKLRLWGINSTIISSHRDHQQDGSEKKMLVCNTLVPARRDNTIFMSLCHHPPECWNDPGNLIKTKMDERVAIQLYGHKHMQHVEFSEKTLVLKSGATHPSRFEEDWIPRYNWITLDIKNINSLDYLCIQIYPRVLNKQQTSFVSENSGEGVNEYKEYKIKLSKEPDAVKQMTSDENITVEQPLAVSSWERKFAYDFIGLPYVKRNNILRELNLFSPEDEGRKHVDLLGKIIERAKEQKCVAELISVVNTAKKG